MRCRYSQSEYYVIHGKSFGFYGSKLKLCVLSVGATRKKPLAMQKREEEKTTPALEACYWIETINRLLSQLKRISLAFEIAYAILVEFFFLLHQPYLSLNVRRFFLSLWQSFLNLNVSFILLALFSLVA